MKVACIPQVGAGIDFNILLLFLAQVNVSELGLVTQGGKVVWGRYGFIVSLVSSLFEAENLVRGE